MSCFSKGDIVVCISGESTSSPHFNLPMDVRYVVSRCVTDGSIQLEGKDLVYSADRFELAENYMEINDYEHWK